jgi:glycosyltransferase involved in cell wall biosynthesis
MIEAMSIVADRGHNVRLILAGMYTPHDYHVHLEQLPGWSYVDFVGWLKRDEMKELLSRAEVGLTLFHQEKNNVEAQPNKLFEYMAAEVPAVASNFPWWRTILEGAGAGIIVDPTDPKKIGEAICLLLENAELARNMGRSGRRAVLETYNWEREAVKLRNLYEGLLQ